MATKLRMKMTEDLRLRGLAQGTSVLYLNCARRFAEFYRKSPADLGTQEVRGYLLHLYNQKLAPATILVYWAALNFLFTITLGRPRVFRDVPKPRVPRTPPKTALTPEEIRALIDAMHTSFDRAFFLTVFAGGLRISEACRLTVDDIDSLAHLIHIRAGKGNKPRSVHLSEAHRQLLRSHWREQRLVRPWLFPARPLIRPGVPDPARWAEHPVSPSTMAGRFAMARERAGLKRAATTHDLRHAYASMLHATGLDFRVIQVLLGHAKPETTARYTHVHPDLIRNCPCPLELIQL